MRGDETQTSADTILSTYVVWTSDMASDLNILSVECACFHKKSDVTCYIRRFNNQEHKKNKNLG